MTRNDLQTRNDITVDRGTVHRTAAPESAESAATSRKGAVIFVAASTAAAAAIGSAAAFLSPLALGGLVFGGSLAAGLTILIRNRKQPSAEPIADLRRELDQTRRGYRQLFASVPCFICVLNRDHHVIEANSLYRTEFDVDDRFLCYEICKKRSRPCVNCLVDQTFENGEVYSGEETLVARDGRRVNVVVHTQPVYDDNNEIAAVMEVFTDVTEVKRLQRQLALTGRAVAGMAHRVKNILMGLEGGIFIVNDGLEQDDRESINQGWEMVERNVGLVSGIVKDLLYCSKDREPNFQPGVCPHEILTEVRDLFADRMAEEHIEIRTEVEQPIHCGTFDRDGLHSLLCNLVANAIDACRFDPATDKNGHSVVLRCKRNGENATVLEVEDDGAGIPEDLNSKVFQDFFSSKGTEGTGIGLLVVQKVAEEHGGKVTFESTPGEGTRFTVSIPSADLEHSSAIGGKPAIHA